MDIEKRILELLYFKDCVIIPGLGGFVSQYVSAKVREETQTFIPPTKEIGFNRELVYDDGILSNYLAECESISISAARILIDEFVDLLKKKLALGEAMNLTSIGSFSYARTGELVFAVSREMNFLTDSFGFSSFHFTRTKSEKEHPLLRSAIFRPGEKGRIIPLPGTQSKPVHEKTFRRLAIAIPLLVAISLLPLNSRNGLRHGQQATLFPLPSLSVVDGSIISAPSELSEIRVQATTDQAEITVDQENENSDPAQTEFKQKSFAIIAGSFSSEKNAKSLQQELLDKNFHPEIWQAKNGFFRVVIQAHGNMSEAQEAVGKLRDELSDIDFWILQ